MSTQFVSRVASRFITAVAASGGTALVGFINAGVGAVQRTLQAVLRRKVSVFDWNVVGDGVADDWAALQACYDANPGRKVDHGDGFTFLVSAELTGYSATTYEGRSIIKAKNAAAITGSLFNAPARSGVVIRELEFDGNAANNGANYGVTLDTGTRNRIEGIYVHATRAAGIRIISEQDLDVRGGTLFDCGRSTTVTGGASTDDHGLMAYSIGATPLKHVRVAGVFCDGNANTRKGFTTYSASPGTDFDVLFQGCVAKNCILGGFYTGNAPGGIDQVGVNFSNCIGDSNYVNFQVSNVRGGALSGCTSRLSTGDSGIQLAGTTAYTVTGNAVDQSFADGIKLTTSCLATTISGNTVTKSNRGAAGFAAINLLLASYTNVSGNVLDEDAAPLTAYGVLEQGASDFNQVSGNLTNGFSTSACLLVGANSFKGGVVGNKMGVGTTAPLNTLDVVGGLTLREVAVVLANGANQNVALPSGGGMLNSSAPTAPYSIGGFAGGHSGRLVGFINYNANACTIKHQDAGSVAANRFALKSNVDRVLATQESILCWYSSIAGAWVEIG